MNKKAQIQMNETIFIVIFIILIIVFGIVFFSQAEGESVRDKQKQFRDLDFITATQFVASLTELECSSHGAEEVSCFDKIKIKSFSNLTRNDWDLVGEYYVSKMGPAIISIKELYPFEEEWIIYNYTGEDGETTFAGQQIQIPISLLDPITNKKSFGAIYFTILRRVI